MKPDAFKSIRQQIILRVVPIALIALAVGFSISHFNSPNPESSSKNLAIIVPAGIALIVFGLYRGINRQKKILESYTLRLEENAIVREQHNTPTIRLEHGEISEITKNRRGSYVIKGKDMHSAIIVPLQIQHQDDLNAALQKIRPIHLESEHQSLKNRFFALFPFAALALMAVVYLSSNKILVGISGTLFTASMVWSFVQIQRGMNYDKKTKRASYWMALVLLSIIGITIAKLLA